MEYKRAQPVLKSDLNPSTFRSQDCLRSWMIVAISVDIFWRIWSLKITSKLNVSRACMSKMIRSWLVYVYFVVNLSLFRLSVRAYTYLSCLLSSTTLSWGIFRSHKFKMRTIYFFMQVSSQRVTIYFFQTAFQQMRKIYLIQTASNSILNYLFFW